MARAYSDDLRRKLLEAHQQGEGTLVELAGRFRVSVGWARKISASFHRTGSMERPPGGKRGPRSRITPELERYLRSAIRQQGDLTLAELSERLRQERALGISLSRLWTILKQMGLRLKKSHSTPPSRTRKESGRSGSSGAMQHSRSIRNGSSSSTKAASPRK